MNPKDIIDELFEKVMKNEIAFSMDVEYKGQLINLRLENVTSKQNASKVGSYCDKHENIFDTKDGCDLCKEEELSSTTGSEKE